MRLVTHLRALRPWHPEAATEFSMMEAPRRALSGLVLGFAIVLPALAQDAAKPIQAEIKKIEEKIKEETERVAKKKDNIKVEFAALQRDDAKASLQAKLAEIGAKHKNELKPPAGVEGDS